MADGILWNLVSGIDPLGSYARGIQENNRQQTILQQLAGQKEDRQFRRETDARDYGFRVNRAGVSDEQWQKQFGAGRADHAAANARADRAYQLALKQFERGNIPAGFERDPSDPTKMRFIPGGPQDPTVLRQNTLAQREPVGPKVQEFEGPDGRKYQARVFSDGRFEPIQAPTIGDGQPLNPYAPPGKMTDTQATSGLYADRMTAADKIIGGLEDVNNGFSGFVSGSIAGRGMLPNVLMNDDRQKFEQAKRDFVNAVLRRESGAVISPAEFANAEQQYFPQPGDSDAVKAQKRKNRETAIHGLYRAAGPAYRVPQGQQEQPQQPAQTGGLAPGQSTTINGVTIRRVN